MSFIIDTRTSPIPANYLAYVDRPCPVLEHATRLVPVPCHNHATASAYADGRIGTPAVSAARTVAPLSAEQAGGCVAGGAGDDAAITWQTTGRVERCHNWATAKALARNNPVSVVTHPLDATLYGKHGKLLAWG